MNERLDTQLNFTGVVKQSVWKISDIVCAQLNFLRYLFDLCLCMRVMSQLSDKIEYNL